MNGKSLVMKLILCISGSLFAVWFIYITISTYLFNREQQNEFDLRIERLATLRVKLNNHLFAGAERDVKTLAKYYVTNSHIPFSRQITDPRTSCYFPFSAANDTQQHKDSDVAFLQMYGSVEQTYYLDSFIINPKFGVSLLTSAHSTEDFMHFRKKNLHSLMSLSCDRGVIWGDTEYIPGKGWVIPVASCDANGVLPGLVLRLDNMLYYNDPIANHDFNVWLDSHNHQLPFSPHLPDEILSHLNNLQDGWNEIPGYRVFRRQLEGPGWQQFILYPEENILKQTFQQALARMPVALGSLLLLATMLFSFLHLNLARPLRDFIHTIHNTGPQSLSVRLPADRNDELGEIARAYNLLLDSLHEQYNALESRVTERTQELMIAKQNAERANRRKSEHLTTISHELRTPLNGSLGAMELLSSTSVDAHQRHLIETVIQCSSSLLDIINNLLDFSRIESGNMSLHISSTSLLPFLDQAMQTIQGPSQKKGIKLSTFVGPGVPLKLDIDGVRLRQVLVNLLGNALKFTDTGCIRLTVNAAQEKIIYSVSDSGMGIHLADQQFVFKPFYQGQDTTQGTGLGLTIACNLAAMMGGRLILESEPGHGTCASLELPFSQQYDNDIPFFAATLEAPVHLHTQLTAWGITPLTGVGNGLLNGAELCFLPSLLYKTIRKSLGDQQPGEEARVPVQPWRLRILLVDDAATNRDIISMMLATLGQDVDLAEGGQQALQAGRAQAYDMVLMDIRMPEMDGVSCAKQWREDGEIVDPECMIIALSANASGDEKIRCKAAGFAHYMTKPVRLGHLANAISLATEFQLSRNIALRAQDMALGQPLLTLTHEGIRNKVVSSVINQLQELETISNNPTHAGELIHKMKGCFGQAGLESLEKYAAELENSIRKGECIQKKQIVQMKQMLKQAMEAITSFAPSHFK